MKLAGAWRVGARVCMGTGIAGAIAMAITMAGAVALPGCHAGLGSGGAAPPMVAGDFTIVERAETGPITALAFRTPYLWAAGAPGLRRWDVNKGDYEEVADATEGGGRELRAIAVDDEGTAWVANATEVGRWISSASGKLHYQGTGSPGTVTVLAPRLPVRSEGVWAGGPGGLYRFDGHRWSVVEGLIGVSVTSLVLDDDGRGVWVGTRGQGLYHAKGTPAEVTPVQGGAEIVADEIVGTATTAVGTRMVAGNAAGEARLYALTLAGTFEFRAPAGVHAVALVARGKEAQLVAGPGGHEQAYNLRPFGPGEPVPAGSIRFSSLAEEKGGRWAGVPTGEALPASVTAVAVGGNDLFCGTARMGVARAEPGRPHPFDGAELVGDANRFSVACETRERCLIVTDGPQAWRTDGDHYEKTSLVAVPEGEVLGLASDPQGGLYALFAEPHFKGLVIAKRAAPQTAGKTAGKAAAQAAGQVAGQAVGQATGQTVEKDDWQPFKRIALELPKKDTPKISFAAISPTGTLWIGLRVASGGDDVGFGAVEIDLQTGVTVQHRPHREGEATSPEALPLPADLTDILFADGATWFSSLSGVYRFHEGQFRGWGETDGLPSDLCWSIGRAGDGTIWAATSEGLARWDGKSWHPAAGPVGATRGLGTDDQGRLWVATSKGLRVLPRGASDLSAAPTLVAGNMFDLTRDRFGRMWVLSSASITLVAPRISVVGQFEKTR